MLNTSEFAKRLQIILETYELSAAVFAQKIEVGRASISHILSGRNKPSLDFVMKVIQAFPEVDLYWLLNGKGGFPKTPTSALSGAPVSDPSASIPSQKDIPIPSLKTNTIDKKIDKIVIFYTDGSFEPYNTI